MKMRQFIVALWALCSCGLSTPNVGQSVTPQVARATFETRANGTDIVSVEVWFPAEASGAPQAGPFPAVILIQGGAVSIESYHWQAQMLAQAGYVVALPRHALDLAFFSIDNGLSVRELLINPPKHSALSDLVKADKIAVAGHSLGGVVAVKLALTGGFQALIVEASYPDSADYAQLPSLKLPSLFVAAQKDCQAKLEAVRAGWEKMPGNSALGVVNGATHFQFSNSDAPDIQRGCPPEISLEESHARIEQLTKAFLHSAFLDGTVNAVSLQQVPGTEVSVR